MLPETELPETELLLMRWARWCWHKPPYIGVPLILGVFIIAIADQSL